MKIQYFIISLILFGCGQREPQVSGEEPVIPTAVVKKKNQNFRSIGILSFDSEKDENFEKNIVLLNPDNSVYCTFSLSRNQIVLNNETVDFEGEFRDKLLELNFDPFLFSPEYSSILFEVEKIESGFATVFVNHNLDRKKIALGDEVMIYENWNTFLQGTIISNDFQNNKVFSEPKDRSDRIDYKESDVQQNLLVEAVKDNWIKIRCSNVCETPCKNESFTGWIKWNDNGKLLVKFLTSC